MPFDYESTGNPAGYIVDYINEGFTQNEGLRQYRDAGGAIRTQTWHQMWGQVSDTLSRSDEMLALNPDVIPSAGQYGEWAAGKGGQFATQVEMMIRDTDTGLLRNQQYTYFSGEAHTPSEAIANAMADFTDADQEAEYGESVQGAIATHVWITVPYAP